ncbi:MAG TPA: hypothetical protein VIE46_08300 [Gemmatimonadales bacterium]
MRAAAIGLGLMLFTQGVALGLSNDYNARGADAFVADRANHCSFLKNGVKVALVSAADNLVEIRPDGATETVWTASGAASGPAGPRQRNIRPSTESSEAGPISINRLNRSRRTPCPCSLPAARLSPFSPRCLWASP